MDNLSDFLRSPEGIALLATIFQEHLTINLSLDTTYERDDKFLTATVSVSFGDAFVSEQTVHTILN